MPPGCFLGLIKVFLWGLAIFCCKAHGAREGAGGAAHHTVRVSTTAICSPVPMTEKLRYNDPFTSSVKISVFGAV